MSAEEAPDTGSATWPADISSASGFPSSTVGHGLGGVREDA